ncbi:hypothetical protein J4E83_003734 [Alternaria metachromatica]|uniref:uncharacterized protein n=1 Tax=Alternaria metachromatica TaxID=283354 RepID=UPI0020C3E3C9|nr:uncharacterized protein J4E83_003734 [Alternaria metachromatica]KAI4626582.1 hypothetical protein J4E83_003734 [Alternaria metachromatica]
MQQQAESAPEFIPNTEKLANHSARGHARQWSRALRQQPLELDEKDREEIEPLSPVVPQPTAAEETGTTRGSTASRKMFWVAQTPWSLKKDGISAALEFTRALIGYVLMLAVMTYNIGFLFAVTGSVLLGEMVFGRYTRGSAGLAEDGCHS